MRNAPRKRKGGQGRLGFRSDLDALRGFTPRQRKKSRDQWLASFRAGRWSRIVAQLHDARAMPWLRLDPAAESRFSQI